MKKNKLIPLALAAAVPFAAAYGVTDYIMHVALDREPPRSLQKLMGLLQGRRGKEDPYAVFLPYYEKLQAKPHETVEILAPDGTKLVGHWFETKGARRVILAVHGWRSAWYMDFCLSCGFWTESGCSVLCIEQRGQGQSGGKYMGFGLTEKDDLPLWLRWIVTRCGDAVPIYLAGVSMGATCVLLQADQPLPGNVRGIMADCGFTSPEAIWEHVSRKNLHLPYVLTRLAARRICLRRLGVRPDAVSTVEALKHSRYPVLLVHGEADTFVPPSMTRENYEACRTKKTLLLVPGAIHAMSYVIDTAGTQAAEKQFWRENDN